MRRRGVEHGPLGHTTIQDANGESYEGPKRSDQEVERKSGKSNLTGKVKDKVSRGKGFWRFLNVAEIKHKLKKNNNK